MDDKELFTRLRYFGLAHLHLNPKEVGCLYFGEMMDYYELYLQESGVHKPKKITYIDEILI